MQNIANLLLFLLSQFIEAVLVTFVALVFVLFVDIISITNIVLSHSITEVSTTLLKYLLLSQIHVLDSNYNLLCTYHNFYIHIEMFYYSIFDTIEFTFTIT